jgi:hypothetical protein
MDYTADSVALLERLGDLGANFLDDTSVVTSDSRTRLSEAKVDVLPVSGVEANGIDLDENIVISKLGLGDLLDGGLALLDVYNSLGSHDVGFCCCQSCGPLSK